MAHLMSGQEPKTKVHLPSPLLFPFCWERLSFMEKKKKKKNYVPLTFMVQPVEQPKEDVGGGGEGIG